MIRVSKDPNLLFQCNLAPPDGMRGCNGDDSDEIEESEEADRVRYKETLGQSWTYDCMLARKVLNLKIGLRVVLTALPRHWA